MGDLPTLSEQPSVIFLLDSLVRAGGTAQRWETNTFYLHLAVLRRQGKSAKKPKLVQISFANEQLSITLPGFFLCINSTPWSAAARRRF
ncbi:MAG TPA: hypothetical protein VJU86_10670, partial [Pyrinomonadaceae bacterium]|nr:hypothetical protein [Pyrinomonadaceae bacterium]